MCYPSGDKPALQRECLPHGGTEGWRICLLPAGPHELRTPWMIHHKSVCINHSVLPGALFHLCTQQQNTILLRIMNVMFWRHQKVVEVLTYLYLASAHQDLWDCGGGNSAEGPGLTGTESLPHTRACCKHIACFKLLNPHSDPMEEMIVLSLLHIMVEENEDREAKWQAHGHPAKKWRGRTWTQASWPQSLWHLAYGSSWEATLSLSRRVVSDPLCSTGLMDRGLAWAKSSWHCRSVRIALPRLLRARCRLGGICILK